MRSGQCWKQAYSDSGQGGGVYSVTGYSRCVYVTLLHHMDSWWGGKEKVKGHKYTMAGRLRLSRMNESVMEEGLKRGIVEMGDEMKGAMLNSPCLSWPTTLLPDGSSRPCPSGPKGTTPPLTSGPNFQVVLIQVTPKVHVDPLHVTPL